VLSWDETRELCADVDIGAHTRSHPVLSTLSEEEARAELAGSKATVEEQLDRPCSSVAIPYGGAMDYSPETVRIAADLGFSTIFSLEEALRPPVHQNGIALVDRICLSPEGGLPGMAAKITWPRIFIPDWTGRLRQQVSRLFSVGGGGRGL
jgi:peptidoglycan/xylan/chitin deacetylase (PgdA/CDA1 family)